MISNCGHDENGRYSGGKAGDQTGTEWQVINWYSRPWKCVLRHPNAKVRAMIASMAKAAAVNNKIGYCQSHRGTFWTNLADSNFDPAQITVACEADCSSGVAAIVKGAGYRLGIDALKKVSTACYTGNLRAALKAAGFEVLTENKFMLWTERRWSEQSATFTSPENRSMYNSSSYDIIKQRETRRGFMCKTQVTNKRLKNARK